MNRSLPHLCLTPAVARQEAEATEAEATEGKVAAALVRRIFADEQTAEARLYQRYKRGLVFLLRRLGARDEDIEDLIQDTFRVVLQRLRSRELAQPEALVGFIRGTARNLFFAERRRRFRLLTEDDPNRLERVEDPRRGPLAEMIRGQETQAVRQLLEDLPNDRDREVLVRFYLGEEDKAVICSDLGLSSLHFNRVVFRARRRFRQLVEDARA